MNDVMHIALLVVSTAVKSACDLGSVIEISSYIADNHINYTYCTKFTCLVVGVHWS